MNKHEKISRYRRSLITIYQGMSREERPKEPVKISVTFCLMLNIQPPLAQSLPRVKGQIKWVDRWFAFYASSAVWVIAGRRVSPWKGASTGACRQHTALLRGNKSMSVLLLNSVARGQTYVSRHRCVPDRKTDVCLRASVSRTNVSPYRRVPVPVCTCPCTCVYVSPYLCERVPVPVCTCPLYVLG